MNQHLFIALNELLAEAQPSRVIKRGNAFSLLEIDEVEKIQEVFGKYCFCGLNIYSSRNSGEVLSLSGESFYKENNSSELEFEAYLDLPHNWTSNEKMQITSFDFNLAAMEISIKVKFA